jgi:tetratricopeptide (TPR) repeat protein
VWLALWLACAVGRSTARADSLEEAKQAFQDGKAAFDRGDYESALTAFHHAAVLQPAPTLYYNIGMTYERLGRYQEAATAFTRYLEQIGPPKNDEDKTFQENLRARTAADRKRPDVIQRGAQAPPPPQQPPPQQLAPPPQQQPPPYYYQPYPRGYPAPMVMPTREERLRQARAKRAGAIALLATGGVFAVVGLTLTIVGCVPQGGYSTYDYANATELVLGVPSLIVGTALLIPGGVQLGRSNALLRQIEREPPSLPPPAMPQAWIFSAPAVRF